MKNLLVFIIFLASLSMTSMSSFADRVFVMAILESFLLYLFGYRQWNVVCCFFILCLISNWVICAYADSISTYIATYLNGILDDKFIYIGCVILVRICSIILAGFMLMLMTTYTTTMWAILIFINLVSFGMSFLLNHWNFFESLQKKLGYHLGG